MITLQLVGIALILFAILLQLNRIGDKLDKK